MKIRCYRVAGGGRPASNREPDSHLCTRSFQFPPSQLIESQITFVGSVSACTLLCWRLLCLPRPGRGHGRSHRSCPGPGVEVTERPGIPVGIQRRDATNLAMGCRRLFVGTIHNKIPLLLQGRQCTALPQLTTGAGAAYEVGRFVRTSRPCCS